MSLNVKVPFSLALNYNVEQAFFFAEKAVTIVCVCKRHHWFGKQRKVGERKWAINSLLPLQFLCLTWPVHYTPASCKARGSPRPSLYLRLLTSPPVKIINKKMKGGVKRSLNRHHRYWNNVKWQSRLILISPDQTWLLFTIYSLPLVLIFFALLPWKFRVTNFIVRLQAWNRYWRSL